MTKISVAKLTFALLGVIGAAQGKALAHDLDSFAVLAGSTVTNTGATVINGNLGVSPGTAVVGFFAPGIVTAPYQIFTNDGVAIQAQIDLTSRYVDLFNRPATTNLSGQDLAGLTLRPGVFAFNTSAQLTGTLTLDAQNNPNAVFIINVGSTLTTGDASRVALINGAQGGNVFFVVGSSATLGTETTLAGQILALTSITLNTGADITCGAALARNGAVTLDTNTISVCTTATVPIVPIVIPPVVTPPVVTPPVLTPPVVVLPDGTPVVVVLPDGTPVAVVPPTTTPVATLPDGTPVVVLPDTVPVIRLPDGTPVVVVPGATPIATLPDGTPVVALPGVLLPSNASPIRIATPAAIEVAGGIDRSVALGGRLPLVFSLLTPAQTIGVLEQLTGEIATAVAPAGRQSMSAFMTRIFDRMAGDERAYAAPAIVVVPSQPDMPATVSVLGYGPEAEQGSGAFSSVISYGAPVPAPPPAAAPWSAWISAYGDETRTDGDTYWGSADRRVDSAGGAVGLDYQLSSDTTVGFAIGAGRSDFDLDGASGSGRIDTTNVALYGRTNFEAAYVAASVAAGYGDVTTRRALTIGTTERFEADFSAYSLAGRIETGYRFDLPEIAAVPGSGWVTPYAGLQLQRFFSPDYTEQSSSNSIFDLAVRSNDSTGLRTELGARFGRRVDLRNEAVLVLHSRLAWAHDDVSGSDLTASFRALPGSDFEVKGADESGDFLLASAGAEVTLDNGLAVGAFVDSAVSSGSTSLSGTGRLSYRW